MAKERRTLDKELRHALDKKSCHEIMDYLMVEFSDRRDFHYNYYFDTPENDLDKRGYTLRLRTIVKGDDISYHLSLKMPTVHKNTFVEYHEVLDEREFRALAYENKLPEGEISDLTSIHGGDIHLINMIKVNRVFGLYQNNKVFFDRISHKGETHYEIGMNIDANESALIDKKTKQFHGLLKKFDIEFEHAGRRSERYR